MDLKNATVVELVEELANRGATPMANQLIRKPYATKARYEDILILPSTKQKTFKVTGFKPGDPLMTEVLRERIDDPGARRFNAIEGLMDGYIFDLDIRENGEAKDLEQFNGIKEIIITFVY